MYRPGASVGDGGTADAIRQQIQSGEFVGGTDHIMKGIERLRNLQNIINTQNLSATDRAIAESLIEDLTDALKETN